LMVVSPSTWASWNFRIKMLSVAEIEKPWLNNQWSINV
jgi:hypothetical protein